MCRVMKDSGVEWIGEIPSGWNTGQFKNIISLVVDNRGKTPPLSENGIKLLEIDSLTEKYPDISKVTKHISKETYTTFLRKYLEIGDILFATVGSIGKSSIVEDGFNYCIAQNIVGFRINNSNHNLFWFYYLKSDTFKKTYLQYNKGNIQASIKVSNLMQGIVCIPSIKEQQQIANFLDEKIQQIENIMQKQNEVIENLKTYKQSLITETITKGLNPNVKMKDSGIEWIGAIPESWKLNKIKYMFEVKKVLIFEEDRDILSVTQNGLKIKDISTNEGQIARSYAGYQEVEINDFVMNHMDLLTGYVDCSKFNGVTSPDYRVFKILDDKNNDRNYYLRIFQMCYKNKIFYGLGQGVSNLGRWRLQTDKFVNFILPVPPLEEQQQIANFLDKKCKVIDNSIIQKQELIEKLEIYKKSLIYEFVTGKREVK